MPQLKQPASLETISMDFLLKFVMRYLDKLNAEGSMEKFCQGVSGFKKDVRDQIPRHLLPEFAAQFFKEWYSRSFIDNWGKSICEAAFEILLDVEHIRLECDAEVFEFVNPRDIHRLRGLETLNIRHSEDLAFLEKCYLNGLVRLLLPDECTDHHLAIIGQNCSKLRSLHFEESEITDGGLRALDACHELRCVGFKECSEISHVGINYLMSVHDKLQVFEYEIWERSDWNQVDGCYFLSCIENPYSSLERFQIKIEVVRDADLRRIVVNFPNLTHIQLKFKAVEDLSILKYLSRLEGICIEYYGMSTRPDAFTVWQSLKDLLTIIGSNIKTLEFYNCDATSYLSYCGSLDFIYKFCPNIEKLELESVFHDFIVPPFQNLKSLILTKDWILRHDRVTIGVENIGAMLNLEWFQLDCFTITADTIRSMMLDDTKFPKLRRMVARYVADEEIQEIEQFIKSRNIDFEISRY